ncbi:hypothetical protein B7494_g7605 [Chlorociboria aeruginascens]|nr:hypothetical protein B7494_g7605 [Chlorociboria aeruginascens]
MSQPALLPSLTTSLPGNTVTLIPLQLSHIPDLYRNLCGEENNDLYTYMMRGPFLDLESFTAHIEMMCKRNVYYPYAVMSSDPKHLSNRNSNGEEETAVAITAFMSAVPEHRRIEIGHVLYPKTMQRSTATTEATFLLASFLLLMQVLLLKRAMLLQLLNDQKHDEDPQKHALTTGLSVRLAARNNTLTTTTTSLAPTYIQANLLVLPSRYAEDFRLLCARNPVPCPLLAESQLGRFDSVFSRIPGLTDKEVAAGLDIRTDIPRYAVYMNGSLVKDGMRRWSSVSFRLREFSVKDEDMLANSIKLPVPRGRVQALEGQIASLEQFITKLISVDALTRDEMLTNFRPSSNLYASQQSCSLQPDPSQINTHPLPIRSRTGHLRKLKDGKAAEFYGPTSFYQISPSDGQHDDPSGSEDQVGHSLDSGVENTPLLNSFPNNNPSLSLAFSPQSDICRHLAGAFFKYQYPYHMVVYREYFLRDYTTGSGPYYSDLLIYAICSMGALASEEIALRELSDVFSNRAQELLYGDALESPNLTTLQALIILGHREIGRGKASKGWLYSGMSFRLLSSMGLHLDPNNWNGSDDSRVEREVSRRVYWAAFIADKQLSLYFGRPPALHPGESDVRDTVRIPYPPNISDLMSYVIPGVEDDSFEDGPTLVAYWIQQAELSKIIHRMIIEVFENRNIKADETILQASVKEIHATLTKWLSDLPARLHWNLWSVGLVSELVLHLHMMYHTVMIILHRPPRHLLQDLEITNMAGDVEICYESLDTIIKLVRTYARNYQWSRLPLTFVHTLASAASVILMKNHINGSSLEDPNIGKPLDQILEAIDGISQTWPCAKQVREVINSSMKKPVDTTRSASISLPSESPESFDLMAGLVNSGPSDPMGVDLDFGMYEMTDADFEEFLRTEDFSTDPFSWNNGILS